MKPFRIGSHFGSDSQPDYWTGSYSYGSGIDAGTVVECKSYPLRGPLASPTTAYYLLANTLPNHHGTTPFLPFERSDAKAVQSDWNAVINDLWAGAFEVSKRHRDAEILRLFNTYREALANEYRAALEKKASWQKRSARTDRQLELFEK